MRARGRKRCWGGRARAQPAVLLQRIQAEVKEILEALPAQTTDYWEGEEHYIMMSVEKGDIRNLFKPICDEYHVPIVNSKGWYSILLRAHIAKLSMKAEARGLKPVLLVFYDHDPAGLKITEKFRKGLRDIMGGTRWDPSGLIIDRFGLNANDIEHYGLTWIENLRTSSGRESRDKDYILRFGRKKCESNALFKNDETLRAGEEICRKAIEKYYGPDALERFREKELRSKMEHGELYEDPVWRNLEEKLDALIEKLVDNEEGEEEFQAHRAEEELDVEVDSRYYGICPNCLTPFN